MSRQLIEHIANQSSLGVRVTRQKIIFSKKEKDRIKKINSIYLDILKIINIDFLKSNEKTQIHTRILDDLFNKKRISIVSVFCPSYKKNINEFGYNSKIGDSTKYNLHILKMLSRLFKKAGCETDISVFFSDLLIENLDKLLDTGFRDDLQNNYQDLIKSAPNCFTIKLLSELDNLSTDIGERGPSKAILKLDSRSKRILHTRNVIFYKNVLGWDDEKVKTRTEDLITSYPYIARSLNKFFPRSYYFWSESALERYLLMPNLKLTVLFPRRSK